jgi:hypothetical protein
MPYRIYGSTKQKVFKEVVTVGSQNQYVKGTICIYNLGYLFFRAAKAKLGFTW